MSVKRVVTLCSCGNWRLVNLFAHLVNTPDRSAVSTSILQNICWLQAVLTSMQLLGISNCVCVIVPHFGMCYYGTPLLEQIYETINYLTVSPSVCLSVCPSIPSFSCCMLLWLVCCCGPGWQEMSINCCAAGTPQQPGHSMEHSSKCGQCHVVSWRRKLNTNSCYATLMQFPRGKEHSLRHSAHTHTPI